ncbi:hypothetical protein [Microbacterium sp. GXF7504]
MADFARFLPLSQRRADDESEVTADRRAQVAALLDEAARILGDADPGRAAEFLDATGLRQGGDLTAAAAAVRAGRRRSIRDLVRTTRALLVLADGLGTTAQLPPAVSGAVALYQATSGPFDRRTVVRGHTVRASDQDWAFGRGPVLEGSADAVLRFLLALSDDPPRPAVAASDPETTVEG